MSSSDAYSTALKGSLKLKSSSNKSDKKPKVKRIKKEEEAPVDASKAILESIKHNGNKPRSLSPPRASGELKNARIPEGKTKAERAFEETYKSRHREKILKMASKSHKERVTEFNKYMDTLSEHHDIPKVGPG